MSANLIVDGLCCRARGDVLRHGVVGDPVVCIGCICVSV